MQRNITDDELSETGLRVVKLLQQREFKKIQADFDYAMRHGRPADQAIAQDLQRELDECGSTGEIDEAKIEIHVSHFGPDSDHF